MSLSEKVLFSSQGSHSYMNAWKWFKAKRARTLPSEDSLNLSELLSEVTNPPSIVLNMSSTLTHLHTELLVLPPKS